MFQQYLLLAVKVGYKGEIKMMSASNKKTTPGGSELSSKSHSDLSDCPVDSGGGNQTFIGDKKPRGKGDTLEVPQSRRGSLASSMGSEFSHATALDQETLEEDWENILQIRKEKEDIFDQANKLLRAMTDACKVQKNVNSTVKEGINNLSDLFDRLKDLHKKEANQQDTFKRGMGQVEEARQCRIRYRARIQGRLLKDAVLAASSAGKRERSPSESSGDQPKPKPGKKKKKKIERPAAEGLPVVTVTPAAPGGVAVKPKVRPGPSAVLVKVAGGQTYAGVLGRIRKDVNLGACTARVVCVRPTPKGDVLLRLGKGSDRQAFAAVLEGAVGEAGSVLAPDKRVMVEVRDLDSLTEASEVIAALDKVFGGISEKRKVTVTPPNKRSLRMAVIDLNEEEAAKLLKLGHLRVGFVSGAVRLRTVVPRCFKCLGYGHRRSECTGSDRSSLCYKCGGTDHQHKDCKKESHCFLCSELQGAERPHSLAHTAGSGACRVFRQALEKAKYEERQQPRTGTSKRRK